MKNALRQLYFSLRCYLFFPVILAGLTIGGFVARSQPSDVKPKSRASQSARTDSVVIAELRLLLSQINARDSVQSRIDNTSLEILERTNAQLNNSFTPMNVAVAVLAVLVGFLAIAAAGLLFYQSKEYREKLQTFLSGYEAVFKKIIEDAGGAIAGVDQKIADAEARLSTANAKEKAGIRAELESLKAERQSITSGLSSTVAQMPVSGSLIAMLSEALHKCSKCGTEFRYKSHNALLGGSLTPAVKCPSCGHVDLVYPG